MYIILIMIKLNDHMKNILKNIGSLILLYFIYIFVVSNILYSYSNRNGCIPIWAYFLIQILMLLFISFLLSLCIVVSNYIFKNNLLFQNNFIKIIILFIFSIFIFLFFINRSSEFPHRFFFVLPQMCFG